MSFTWGEHVGELELRLEAADETGVFALALDALAELLGEDEEPADSSSRVTVAVSASGRDRATLLAAWLDELLFLAETEGLVPLAAGGLELGDGRVRAQVTGYASEPRHLVKAVTYHRLSFAEREGGWEAVAVLDV